MRQDFLNPLVRFALLTEKIPINERLLHLGLEEWFDDLMIESFVPLEQEEVQFMASVLGILLHLLFRVKATP